MVRSRKSDLYQRTNSISKSVKDYETVIVIATQLSSRKTEMSSKNVIRLSAAFLLGMLFTEVNVCSLYSTMYLTCIVLNTKLSHCDLLKQLSCEEIIYKYI